MRIRLVLRMSEKITHPINENWKFEIQDRISTDKIIEGYKRVYDFDCSYLFADIQEVNLCRCEETGFRFYSPRSISGDSKFYEYFENFEWYYLKWKWEHDESLEYIKSDSKVLEVGCGRGDFISKVHQDIGAETVGLELNKNSALSNPELIVEESVQEHAEKKPNFYDVVCSFQVLEHISDVGSFLMAKTKCLKPGGIMIICVPNNDSFIKLDHFNLLNMPPHHMGLWNEESLRSLSNELGLEHVKTSFEPLQEYHLDYYYRLKCISILGERLGSYFTAIINKFGLKAFVHGLIRKRSKRIKGHSIFIAFRKL